MTDQGRSEHEDFVAKMLESANEKKKVKPYRSTDEDPQEVEKILKGIKEKIQQNR